MPTDTQDALGDNFAASHPLASELAPPVVDNFAASHPLACELAPPVVDDDAIADAVLKKWRLRSLPFLPLSTSILAHPLRRAS